MQERTLRYRINPTNLRGTFGYKEQAEGGNSYGAGGS